MNREQIKTVVQVFLQNMLVHILYMIEYQNSINLVFVTNDKVSDDVIIEIENTIEDISKSEVNILNAYEFDVADRMEIIKKGELIYCENKLIKQIFEIETATAMKSALDEKSRFLERKAECASYYLQ